MHFTMEEVHNKINFLDSTISEDDNKISFTFRSADKSLARPGRKQATATKDFHVHISYLLS